ncbi:MAG: ABC transporter substrate-binding protein [Alphaproteobacteria bacterium]|nr:ABC transporter substrate-binding protein [Alphaproteobacteria bacterium]
MSGPRRPFRSAAAGLFFFLSVCGPAQAEKVGIAVLKLASSGAIFIAQKKGYFAQEGLDVELNFLDAAQPVALAVVAGDAEFGATGLTAGFYNLAGKGALRIIGGQSREQPGYHLSAYLAGDKAFRGGLTSLAGLPGHSVAITQIGSTFHYSLGLLAAKLGFDLASLRLVPLQSMTNMAAALKGGQVDLALMPGTIAAPMASRGEAHVLGWVGDETPWQVGGLFASSRTVAERRPEVEKFMRAYRRGARELFDAFLARGPDGAAQEGAQATELLAILAEFTGQPSEQLRGAVPYVDPEARVLVPDIYNQVAWYQRQGLVDKTVSAETILVPGLGEGDGAPAMPAAPAGSSSSGAH